MASPHDRQHQNHDDAVSARAQRETRLAAALRANLKRRKAQAQARKTDPPANPGTESKK